MSRDQILSPRHIEGLIAEGATIVIFEDAVLKLDSWLTRHPGGKLAIQHMVGRDATDEITAFHKTGTRQTMKAYRIGRKPTGTWVNMTPPIRGGVFRKPSTPSISLTAFPESEHTSEQVPPAAAPTVSAEAEADVEHTLRRRLPGLSAPALASVAGDYVDDDKSSVGDSGYGSRESDDDRDSTGSASTDGLNFKCPTKYADWVIQQGVDNSLRDYPSLDERTQQDIVRRYRLLHQQVIDENLYQCRYSEYGKEAVRYAILFATSMVFLHYQWYITSAVFLGLFWQQLMFTAHDAGHRAITTNFTIDTLIGMFIADFCCGLSIGWWKSSHNVHHLITNHPLHDPDIQNVPIFCTSNTFFKSISSSYYDGFVFAWDKGCDLLVPIQAYTYYPIMAVARFNLYFLSWLHVISGKSSGLASTKVWWIRPAEAAFMTCYWFLFGYCLVWRTLPTWTIRVIFVLISHMMLMLLHVQINLSHWGMSTSDLGDAESFPQRQMRTTMDVDCPKWLDFLHGGLQFQTAHHLFPRVPRHNLRRCQELAMDFSKDTGIPYSILSFVDGNKQVIGHLDQVGEQVRILVNCQKSMAEKGEIGMH